MEVVTNLSEKHQVKPALCLDFDGTIRRSKSGQTFIQNFNDIELMPNIEKIIWRYRNMGWRIFFWGANVFFFKYGVCCFDFWIQIKAIADTYFYLACVCLTCLQSWLVAPCIAL